MASQHDSQKQVWPLAERILHGHSRSLTPQELGSSGAWLLVWGGPFSTISLLLLQLRWQMQLSMAMREG